MVAAGFNFVSLLASIANAAPTVKHSSITPLSSEQISSFKPFTFFASAAYCNPSTTINWSCHADCAANSDFIPVASGGDGGSVQFWYVGFSPSQASVIVAHQGTEPSKIEADITDTDLVMESLDTTLFPGVSSSVQTHSGFANEQAKTATKILSAVQAAIAAHRATQVTTVGHSLGAAIALLDAVYLPLHISGVSFKMIGYGMPRVGNQEFANYVDRNLDVMHINNKKDVVPIVPGLELGYHHPSGEVHIMDNNLWVYCRGQDDPSKECIVGAVPFIFDGKVKDHSGPYDGVTMGVGC